ncbi:hypothetical protein B6S59_29715 [Pseudomonas sp. A46]|jgi:enamine deaminase RidA (YjgF/YER057c/UK114 family)|nr:RidA family protein [Pseudomonas sp. A46]OWJ89745.1 hypothetical protein B6S59_29715 [Pseudomonas sp. A46]
MSSTSPKRRHFNTPSTQALYDNYHFPQATRVGDMIWVSGQVGLDASLRPGKGVEEQSHLAFQSLQRALDAAGASLADVVELMSFHTNLHGDMQTFSRVKDQYFRSQYPSWTAIGILELAMPELHIEIRAVAVAGCGQLETAKPMRD